MLINSNLRKTGDSDRRFETSSCKFYLPVSNNMVANWQIFFLLFTMGVERLYTFAENVTKAVGEE